MYKIEIAAKCIGIFLLFLRQCQSVEETTSDIRKPPRILEEWNDKEYFQQNTDHTFHCKANGSPIIKYSLFKNNDVIAEDQTTDSFKIPSLRANNAGEYHCTAKNQHGISSSRKMELIMATEVLFDKTKVNYMDVNTPANSLKIDCKPLIIPIIPYGDFTWHELIGGESNIPESKETQIDEYGTIYFSNLFNYRFLKKINCKAKNSFLQQWANSAETNVHIHDVDGLSDIEPLLMTSSSISDTIVALEGEKLTLRCLFSGYPLPSIKWYLASDPNKELPTSAWNRMHGDTYIRYKSVNNPDMAGSYICKGTNKAGSASHEMKVLVESKPTFSSLESEMKNGDVTEGEDFTMKCVTKSKPAPEIKWYKNGQELNSLNMPSNYFLSEDHTELNVTDVCKLCDTPDLAVFQYQASNTHGSVYSEASLNVLEATKIDPSASNIDDVIWEADQNVTFKVVATTDPSTPLSYQWYFGEDMIVEGNDPRFVVDAAGELDVVMEGDDEGGLNRVGEYKVMADNGYSTDQQSMRIIHPSAVIAAWVFPWWGCLLLTLLILLLLLLLLCLLLWCCGCFRNDSKDYPVDKNERAKGIDPAREYKEQGFKDYQNSSLKNNGINNNSSVLYNNNFKSDVSNNGLVVGSQNNSRSQSRAGNASINNIHNRESVYNQGANNDNYAGSNIIKNDGTANVGPNSYNSRGGFDNAAYNEGKDENLGSINRQHRNRNNNLTVHSQNYNQPSNKTYIMEGDESEGNYSRVDGTKTLSDPRRNELYTGTHVVNNKTLPGPGYTDYEIEDVIEYPAHTDEFKNYSYQTYDYQQNGVGNFEMK